MPLPFRPGYQLLTRWRPILIHPSVRNIIAGRSRSETPQAVPDGLFPHEIVSSLISYRIEISRLGYG